MDKQHFLTRLGKWTKIRFSEVCITPGGNSIQPELYVRDRTDPPCWLFIRRLDASENPASLQAIYTLWLAEFHRHRDIDFSLPPSEITFQVDLPPLLPAVLPAERQSRVLPPSLIAER